MKTITNEDYFHWCCDWCDTENSVLWAEVDGEMYCGACHKLHLVQEAA
jgi:hypothetical protein